jgi:ABC-2 type transport system permease protein
MSRPRRIRAETVASARAFLRRRTAVFFTFFFPVIIVLVFGVLVQTKPGGGGLFTEPPAYYIAGYLAVVVLFTPLSRIGSEVARHRDGNRFEKLATTPLTRTEWLLAETLVNVCIIGLAGAGLFALVIVTTGASVVVTGPTILAVTTFLVLGVALFCGVGAMLGSLADSQDGVIAASNSIALPLLFLSETFVPPALLPAWVPTALSPLTHFARGVRAVTMSGDLGAAILPLGILAVGTVISVAVGARTLPRTD